MELPRSIRLALWGSAALRGDVPVARAVAAVTGDDEPHTLEADPTSLLGTGADLTALLTTLATLATPGLSAALPAPGDALGLPGPTTFNTVALDAGEAVVAEPGVGVGPLGLVPQITPFGSDHEPGVLVTWLLRDCNPRRVTDVGSLAEADRALREGLREATEQLTRLDVSRWRPDAAARLGALRRGGPDPGELPPGTPPRAVSVLATATRLRAVIDLAAEDDGAAVSGYEMQGRTRALRDLDAVCRRALVAAANAWAEPTR